MASIRGVSVPMYTALRRTTVAFTMAMEFLIARQTYPPEIIIRYRRALLCYLALPAMVCPLRLPIL